MCACADDVLPVCNTLPHGAGPIEAASHVETSMTQLVQSYGIRAQVREVQRHMGVHIDRTERIANSLGTCAGLIENLKTIHALPKVWPSCERV
jgi:hypothetical protein